MGLLATDNFNRANANPIGAPWTTITSDSAMQIVSNACTPSSLAADCGAFNTSAAWPGDQYSKAKLSVTGTGGAGQGVCLHVRVASGANTYYRLAVDHAATNNVTIEKHVAGTPTTLPGFPLTQAWTDGDTWEIRAVGTLISVYRNGTLVGSATDTAIASGSAGMGYSSVETAASIDDWEGGSIDANAPLLGSLTLKSATGARIMAVKIGNYLIPNSVVASNIVLTADVGSLILTGFAPSLDLGVQASLGQLVLNGFAPSLDQKVNAALGSLVLTGFAPSLDQKINAALGALTLTGFAPSLDQKINAALGQLVLTGFAPSLNMQLNAAVGQLVLNGFAASPVIGTNLIAQLGSLDLTGFAPTVDVTNNISILAGLGQLLIDGFTPDVTGQDTATPVAGTGPSGDRRMALMEELRELQQTLAQEKEPQHKGFRDDRVVKRRKEIEAALRLEQKREAARLAAEVAAENEDEEGLLNIILNFLGGSDVS